MSQRARIVVRVRDVDVARAEALLELAGAESTSLADAADVPLLEPEPGTTPLWPEVSITALFDAGSDLDRIAAWLDETLGGAASIRIPAPKEGADPPPSPYPSTPFTVGRRLLVLPADTDADPGPRCPVRLRMGLAFGTGSHPTTRMCLEWLDAELEPGSRLVDYGCGSGILGIAALALGAASVRAVDVEPQALQATGENAELNGVADRMTVSRPDGLEGRDYDLVLANILSIPLIGLAGTFSRLLRPAGRVVLTGILEPQAERVLSAYTPSFEILEHRVSEGWALLAARRKRSTASAQAQRG